MTVDRRPIAFVDLETFKGHAYPDVLISVLIKTFSEFADWLDSAAIKPSKTRWWIDIFRRAPTRSPFNKREAHELAGSLRSAVRALHDLLFSEDNVDTERMSSAAQSQNEGSANTLNVGSKQVGVTYTNEALASIQSSRQETEKYTKTKLDHLHRRILEFQNLFCQMRTLSGGDAFLFLDDLYHIRRKYQAQVIDYFHRIAKGNGLWIKVGTIRHRTQWYIHGDPPIGAKIGDDIGEIDLDLTLEKYSMTSNFLGKILETFLGEAVVKRDVIMTRGAFDRLVLASGGVARDFLGLFRRSILVARERGSTARGEKVGVEDVNGAAGEYDSSKREELGRDTLDERQLLEDEFTRIGKFVNFQSKANVFLIDKNLPASESAPIEELVDLRLVHRVRDRVTVADRPGKIFEAYMLDISQYTASRKRRELKIIEFWTQGSTDAIRRPGLIYKEMDGDSVVVRMATKAPKGQRQGRKRGLTPERNEPIDQ